MAAPPILSRSQGTQADAKRGMMQAASGRWQGLSPREQTLVVAALLVLVIGLLWWVAVAPALGVLKDSRTQRDALDAQLQQMQTLQAQAKALQALPKVKTADAGRALETLAKQRFGAAAQLSTAGGQATLTLTNASAEALAQFLSQARSTANALPSQARLRRSASNSQAWDGTLVMVLPAS
jgi:general secretion pathway protein M